MMKIKLNEDSYSYFKRMAVRTPHGRRFSEVVLKPLFGLKRLQAYDQLRRGKALVIPDVVWDDVMSRYFVQEPVDEPANRDERTAQAAAAVVESRQQRAATARDLIKRRQANQRDTILAEAAALKAERQAAYHAEVVANMNAREAEARAIADRSTLVRQRNRKMMEKLADLQKQVEL